MTERSTDSSNAKQRPNEAVFTSASWGARERAGISDLEQCQDTSLGRAGPEHSANARPGGAAAPIWLGYNGYRDAVVMGDE